MFQTVLLINACTMFDDKFVCVLMSAVFVCVNGVCFDVSCVCVC